MENVTINPENDKHFYQLKVSDFRIRVFLEELVLADTTNALLKEVGNEIYDGVFYILEKDVASEYFFISSSKTYCPIKGEASYLSFELDGYLISDIAWTYKKPLPISENIKGMIGFYQNKVSFRLDPNQIKSGNI